MLQVTREFHMPAWDDSTWEAIASFWALRGFRCDAVQDSTLRGTRGSLLGNCISFNMSRLKTNLVIERIGAQECRCSLNINTAFQVITEYNKAHWRLELDTFEGFMTSGDLNSKEWRQYRSRAISFDILIVIGILAIAGILGFGAGVLSGVMKWVF